jgi:hypothetical protein
LPNIYHARRKDTMKSKVLTISLLLVLALSLGSALAASGSLPGGTEIAVTISEPVTCTDVFVPPNASTASVEVKGEASVGQGVVVKDTTLVYIMDVSNSMNADAGVDCDGVAGSETRLECEQEGVKAANTAAAAANSSVDETGLGSFSDGGTAHDVDLGTDGTQYIVAPDYDGNGNDEPDVEDVAFGLTADGWTCYSCGLDAANMILGSSTNSVNVVIFMSDGVNNRGVHVNTMSLPSGAIVHAFAMGTGVSCENASTLGDLNDVRDLGAAGSTCQQVTNLSDLADKITEAIGSTLDSLEIEADSGGASTIPNADIDPDLPQDGPASVDYDTLVTGLGLGDHTICVTANGTDVGGPGSVQECVTIHVYAYADGAVLDMFVVDPPTEIDVSDEVDITVREVVHNFGPFGPTEFEVTFNAVAPPGCNIVGPAQIVVPVTLPVSENREVDAIFTIHCSEPSFHTFTFNNEIRPVDPYVIDPYPDNNIGATWLDVAAIAYADVEIAEWFVPTPASQLAPVLGEGYLLISEWVTINTVKTLHNQGPWGPVDVVGATTVDAPGIDVSGPAGFTFDELEVSVPAEIGEDFDIHCYEPCLHSITLVNEITDVEPQDVHVVDPETNNNRVERTLEIECVIPIPVDIKPQSCRNPLEVDKKGVLPVAILGTADFDVSEIDPATVELMGVAPLRWAMEDVATPYEPYVGKQDAFDCTEAGPDGFVDLTLKFDAQEIVAALGDVSDGDVLVLHLRGLLKDEFGSHTFFGEDVIVILKKK